MDTAESAAPADGVLRIPVNAFNDLVALSLGEETTESALEKIARVARQTISGAADVSVTMLRDGEPSTLAFTGSLAVDLDEAQYGRGHGPCMDAAVGGSLCKIDDMRTETRWADFTAAAVERGCLSSISVPLPDHGALLGALNVYATSPRAFDETACEVGRSFAAFASVAIRNVVRYETAKREAEALQRAMESRAVIEQAKGLLMGRHRCTADEAFEMLVHLSQSRNVKLRDVAAALIAETVESRPDAD
ncbi:MAG: ANTAR domain-containing protein [Actinomycetes bacterium]